MANVWNHLGERIVQAARMAVAIHLEQEVQRSTRQRDQAGGAGDSGTSKAAPPFTDDPLPTKSGRLARPLFFSSWGAR